MVLPEQLQGGERCIEGRLDRERYEQAWDDLMANCTAEPEQQYLTYHKERFYELFDHLALYLQSKPAPHVLEIGVSAFTKLYKILFPHLQLVTVDRPVVLYGSDTTFTQGECGAERHYNLDLNREQIGPQQGEPSLGLFDYVIFSEVLEHLLVNPVQLFGELLSLLAPNGLLYLTTPNFFSLYHLGQLAEWENPQAVFPRRGEDRHAGFHFREYTMQELIVFFEQAGGEIVKAHFSDCWDVSSLREQLDRTPQFRSDLMVVVCQRGAEIARSRDTAQLWPFAKPKDPASVPNGLLTLQYEVEQLREVVRGYERGRLMRLLKWLHQRRIFHF